MGHEELKEIGINAYGHRHKILKAVKERITNMGLGYLLNTLFKLLCYLTVLMAECIEIVKHLASFI